MRFEDVIDDGIRPQGRPSPLHTMRLCLGTSLGDGRPGGRRITPKLPPDAYAEVWFAASHGVHGMDGVNYPTVADQGVVHFGLASLGWLVYLLCLLSAIGQGDGFDKQIWQHGRSLQHQVSHVFFLVIFTLALVLSFLLLAVSFPYDSPPFGPPSVLLSAR
jgi:hypothetical protein